jgi:NAD(P)H-hydrate epimerase
MVDREIQDVLAANAGGVMVSSPKGEGESAEQDRFIPQAVLLGPGWSWTDERARILQTLWEREQRGLALVLDADAIAPAKGYRFSGRTIFTPHPIEFLRLLEPGTLTKEELAADPIPPLRRAAQERNATIVLKGHVLHIVSPDGRVSVVDGMVGALAAGGSGDLLAGFTVALAARMARLGESWDPHTCALGAAALLIQAGREAASEGGFIDPLEIAPVAARLAGSAWL